MSAATIASVASVALVFICLAAIASLLMAAIASLLMGAMASINNSDPRDRGMTDLGHRCVVWVSVALLLGVAMMLTLENVAP